MIRCVALDLGGVMVDINTQWADSLAQAGFPRKELGHLVDFHGTDRAGNGEWDEPTYYAALGEYLGVSAEDAVKVHDAVIKSDFPGVSQLISRLHEAGLKVGCLTNTNRPHLHLVLRQSKVIHEVDAVVASYLVGFNKPEKGIYEVFERELGVGAHEIVFFDDWPPNVDGAEDAGWRAFCIDSKADPPAQIVRHLAGLGIALGP